MILASTSGIRQETSVSLLLSQLSSSINDRCLGTFDFGDSGSRRGLPMRQKQKLTARRTQIMIIVELLDILGSVQEKLLNKVTFLSYLHLEFIIESFGFILVFSQKVVR